VPFGFQFRSKGEGAVAWRGLFVVEPLANTMGWVVGDGFLCVWLAQQDVVGKPQWVDGIVVVYEHGVFVCGC
jgi:hypothetical protein